MSISEEKDRLTELLNRAVRKYTARVVGKTMSVKPTTVWQWSAGERENPLTQTLEFLVWLKTRDKELFNDIAEVFLIVLNSDAYRLQKIKRFTEHLFESFLDDYRFDAKERAELTRMFEELLRRD